MTPAWGLSSPVRPSRSNSPSPIQSCTQGPTTGSPESQAPSSGRPRTSSASKLACREAISSRLVGVASAMGRPTSTNSAATITPAATPAGRRSLSRRKAKTGQVEKARMTAQSSAETKGRSTRRQATPSAASAAIPMIRATRGVSMAMARSCPSPAPGARLAARPARR
ncbi:hypothetical protein FHS88_001772 [Roseomonas alkaliterrae]|uniref:Uncharacterized protein n=1 Tax=Neoroseomonas alkaliterrae TaxID=1452450 RepID=A0A840XZP7_9PROT|nr:hypothetical protein [Neoroseomonas alkaliterrae]